MTAAPAAYAALYLRSSKDRSDVSIEAQRHELVAYAAEKCMRVVAEYVDVVESGKEEDRPGLLDLYRDLQSKERAWSTVIALDTSRIARRRYIAINFERDCQRRGVRVMYKSLAGVDAETEVLMLSIFQGMDEWHSQVSRRKSLMGMATNVRRGFRAGGRAPIGYRLHHTDTGAVREGRAVLKSRLELDEATSPAVQRYLRARAAGRRRGEALAESGLDANESSLVGIEWNALTYAGFTVWNVNRTRVAGGYEGGTKRRPRSEWEVKAGTHPALITEEEAETILAQLEAYSVGRPRRSPADYLLTGLLVTNDGNPWKGQQGRYYRTGNKHVQTRTIDATVLEKVAEDLRSREFARRILEGVQRHAGTEPLSEARRMKQAAAAAERQISRFMDMAAKLETPGPVLRKVDELERERVRLEKEAEALQREAERARAARTMTEAQVFDHLDTLAAGMEKLDRERLKDFLQAVLERVTADPDDETLQLHYRIPLQSRLKVASPRSDKLKTYGKLTTSAKVKKAA